MMKRLVSVVLLGALTLGANAFAQNPPAQGSAPQQSTAEQNTAKARAILDKMIQALGGQAYLNMQDMTQEGRTYGFSHGESGGGAPFWRFYKYPDKDRIELTKQRDWIIIHNGDKGWEQTFRGTAFEDPEALKGFLEREHYSLDHILRVWLHEPGMVLFYDGAAIAERKQADKVTLLNAKNESVTIFVDTNTSLPIKRSYQKRNPLYKDVDTEDEAYDNWHMVQGIQTPYDITRYHNGETQNQRFINKVTYNSGIAESMFEPKGPVKDAK